MAATIRFVTQQQRDALAERVRAEMERRQWNNPKLAREANLSEKTISRVINARKDPRLDTIERIARAFEMDEIELRPPPPPPLGLGADGEESQLDRIEANTEQLLKLLKRLEPEEAPETPASAEEAADVAADAVPLSEAIESTTKRTPGRSASRPGGRRRKPA